MGEAITTRHVPLLNRQPQPTLRFNVDTLLAPFENNFSFSSLLFFWTMPSSCRFLLLQNFENIILLPSNFVVVVASLYFFYC